MPELKAGASAGSAVAHAAASTGTGTNGRIASAFLEGAWRRGATSGGGTGRAATVRNAMHTAVEAQTQRINRMIITASSFCP